MIKATFFVIINFLFKKRSSTKTVSTLNFIVMPWHLDLNLNVDNAKYLSYCNQARLVSLSENGTLRFIFNKKIRPVITTNTITYKSALRLFDRFTVRTRIHTVEEETVAVTHEFYKKGKLIAKCDTSVSLLSATERTLDPVNLSKEFDFEFVNQ